MFLANNTYGFNLIKVWQEKQRTDGAEILGQEFCRW